MLKLELILNIKEYEFGVRKKNQNSTKDLYVINII